jgi:hypothetical protein
MRADMAKVIVERPRKRGHAWTKPKGYLRKLNRLRGEGEPVHEGMKKRWQDGTKFLNEHLGPLRRYLDSQVGRPWDKVFAEICAHINRSSAVQDHVRDHVEDYVTVHALLVDGVPCSGEGDQSYGKALHQMPWKRWYVCPRTSLLRRVKKPRKSSGGGRNRQTLRQYVRVSETLQCHFLDGAWHLVTLKPLAATAILRLRSEDWDLLLNRPVALIAPHVARKHYGAAVYATAKRPLAHRELAQYPVPVDSWR